MTPFNIIYDFLLGCHFNNTIFVLFDVQNIVTLKSWLRATRGHWKWHYSTEQVRVPIRLPL